MVSIPSSLFLSMYDGSRWTSCNISSNIHHEMSYLITVIIFYIQGESAVKKAVERINRKNMKDIWMKWAMEHHSFSMVKLSDAEVAGFSGAVKEFLINDEEDRDILVLPSLKYTFPAIPKPNEKPKPLTNDQRQQNMIFMRELRKVWRRAKDEMANRVVEFKAQGMNINNVESERKSKAAGGISSGRSTGSLSSRLDEDDGASNRLEAICLNELGLKRFRQWIEEDEDEKSKREAEALAEKLRDAKSSHEQFVKKKDRY